MAGESYLGGAALGGAALLKSHAASGGGAAEEARTYSTVMAQELYGELAPMMQQDAVNGYAGRAFCEAICLMFAQTEEAVRALEGFDPWSQTLDVKRCPGWLLPWLAQVVGVKPPLGIKEAELRALIEAEGGWRRGWLTSFMAAVQGTLTGAKRIRVTERSSSAYSLIVNTKASETPSASATAAAGALQKAEGLIVTYTTSELPLMDEATRTIDAAAGAIDTATVANVT